MKQERKTVVAGPHILKFNISDINVAILNRLDDNKYSYKQLLFEALRCYLYNFSSLNFNAEEEHMGKTIKTIRVAEDINITEASLRSGVAISTICKTEKGNTEFSLNNIKNILGLLIFYLVK